MGAKESTQTSLGCISGALDYPSSPSQQKWDGKHGIAEHLPPLDSPLKKLGQRQSPVGAIQTALNIPLIRSSGAGDLETDKVLHSLSAFPRPVSKPGVASLLFHRTLSPSEALQVHSYSVQAAKCHQHNSKKTPVPDLTACVKTDVRLEDKPNPGPEQSGSGTELKADPVKVSSLKDVSNLMTCVGAQNNLHAMYWF